MILINDSGRRSKVYIKNGNGPRHDPCKMLLVIDNLSDCLQLTTTACVLSVKNYYKNKSCRVYQNV